MFTSVNIYSTFLQWNLCNCNLRGSQPSVYLSQIGIVLASVNSGVIWSRICTKNPQVKRRTLQMRTVFDYVEGGVERVRIKTRTNQCPCNTIWPWTKMILSGMVTRKFLGKFSFCNHALKTELCLEKKRTKYSCYQEDLGISKSFSNRSHNSYAKWPLQPSGGHPQPFLDAKHTYKNKNCIGLKWQPPRGMLSYCCCN